MKKDDRLNIRIDLETKEKIKEAAEKQNRTVSNYIKLLIKNDLENQK